MKPLIIRYKNKTSRIINPSSVRSIYVGEDYADVEFDGFTSHEVLTVMFDRVDHVVDEGNEAEIFGELISAIQCYGEEK